MHATEILVSVLLAALGFVILYWVIRTAVVDAMEEVARRRRRDEEDEVLFAQDAAQQDAVA